MQISIWANAVHGTLQSECPKCCRCATAPIHQTASVALQYEYVNVSVCNVNTCTSKDYGLLRNVLFYFSRTPEGMFNHEMTETFIATHVSDTVTTIPHSLAHSVGCLGVIMRCRFHCHCYKMNSRKQKRNVRIFYRR